MKRAKVGKKIDMQALREKHLPLQASEMRFLPAAAWENKAFQFLRQIAARSGVEMTGVERAGWVSAKLAGEADSFAEDNGWTLSEDIPAIVKERLSSGVDFLAFEDAWERSVGTGWPMQADDAAMSGLARYVNEVADRGVWRRGEF